MGYLISRLWLYILRTFYHIQAQVGPHPKSSQHRRCRIAVASKRSIISSTRTNPASNLTTPGTYARNECDTHADTCCAGTNWKLMELTNEICEVSPFLGTYKSVKHIPVARCCTVWTDPSTSLEYLLVADQMLWFGTMMDHSLLNPNQIRAYNIPVNDNPYTSPNEFGIKADDAFIPFRTMGTTVYFNSRTLTEWEERNLPVILLTGDTWDPVNVDLGVGSRTREQAEMRTP